MSEEANRARPRWIVLAAALGLLNLLLTFENVWPTPAVKWTGEWSVELAICVLVFAAIGTRRPVPRLLVRALAALWVVLIVGRYADVTVPALFGRPVNLYWDSRHLRAVGEMLATSASLWIVVAVVAALVLVPLLLYWPSQWALARVAAAVTHARERRALAIGAAIAIALFAVRPLTADIPLVPRFAVPPTTAYVRQAALVATEIGRAGSRQAPPSPPLTGNLARVRGVDTLLVFIESYGAVTYDDPAFARGLAASRARLEADVRDSGRSVVSAFVESPTFGGSSWLAHISLLSGIEVRDEDTSVMLLAQERPTLVSAFAQHGFRTVALMPGLQQVWPEGRFYGFDAIYRGNQLEYQGPDFGWWSVPDQFSLARFDRLELQGQSRAPVFAFFPTISTHAPFSPIAPYQPDWPRVVTPAPYDEADVTRALDEEPDWMNLGPSYVNAVAYDLASLGGYLRFRAGHDLVMVLIGDHQPPSAVAGEGSRWDVPVHVVASRPEIIDALTARGFRPGLTPGPRSVAKMHELTTMLLDAFSDHAR